jgi:signal transduction histidine kinase/ligand-binding sensor domain-containing protein
MQNHKFEQTVVLAIASTIFASCALALDTSQPPSSYVRKNFTVEDGLPGAAVQAIVETKNGFLWVGTNGGLARFDGERFEPININGGAEQQIPVLSLLTTPDGDLWVGTDAGLARIPSSALDHFDPALVKMYHLGVGLADQVLCIQRSRDGGLWVGTSRGLYRFEGDKFVPVIAEELVSRIENNSDGHLLIVTWRGFVEWDGTRIIPHPEIAAQLGVDADTVFHVIEDRKGVTWYCTGRGVARRVNGRLERLDPWWTGYLGPHSVPPKAAWRAYEDPQGNTWIISQAGLFRASGNRVEPMTPGLEPRIVYSDREGDLWVSDRNEGLIRFKDRAVWTYGSSDGLPNNRISALLRSHDGTLWVGNNCGGISRFDGQRFHNYAEKDGLSNSCVWALAEDTMHDLWIGTWGGGLYRFRNGQFTQYAEPQGLPTRVVVSLVASPDGSLWVATSAGLVHMQNGHFRNYTVADGLSSDRITTVYQDRGGTIWVGTSEGVDHLVGDRFATVPRDTGSNSALFRTIRGDSQGNLYALSQVNGISRLQNNRLVSLNETLPFGDMIESDQHDLWFSGRRGIARVSAGAFDNVHRDPESPLEYTSFGPNDGMNTTECSTSGQPDMAITPDGHLWVATIKGLARLDLKRLKPVDHQPPVYIEDIKVDRTRSPAGRELVLSPGTHHVEFYFTAIDLASPEKIHLQYRLDGVDPLWLDAGSDRTAIYTSIPAGNHSLHVRASNRDGNWDSTGIVFSVTQQPFLYETLWFRLSAVALVAFLIAAAYQRRVGRMAQEFNVRLEERLAERARIARDLHDTLLQSFQGVLMKFSAIKYMMRDRPDQAEETLERIIGQARAAITEGRDAVQELRSSTAVANDLVRAITSLGEGLAADHAGPNCPEFRLSVEGKSKDLPPLLRDDVYKIACECVRNAFLHAQPQRIEVQIRYDPTQFRLHVQDNGKGIDPAILGAGGRAGHHGLPGIRERAELAGGKLSISSQFGSGTKIELTIPASIAYAKSSHSQGMPAGKAAGQ